MNKHTCVALFLFAACATDVELVDTPSTATEASAPQTPRQLRELGRISEAALTGQISSLADDIVIDPDPEPIPLHPYWEENRDNAFDPRNSGCACLYDGNTCPLPIMGRVVDECFPADGVTLVERSIGTCQVFAEQSLSCVTVYGAGWRCVTEPITCCGVQTTSGKCVPPPVDPEPVTE